MKQQRGGRAETGRHMGSGAGCHGAGRLVRLGELVPGQKGTIERLSGRGKLRRRLMDMGVVAGTPVEVVKVAPLGDPVELKVKGFHLTLRNEEALDIWVEVTDGQQ